MIIRILAVIGIFIVIALVIFWVVSGGIGSIINQAKTITDSSEEKAPGFFRLPWQPEGLLIGPDIKRRLGVYGQDADSQEADELASLQKEYEKLNEEVEDAKNFGIPSPHRGKVQITNDGSLEESADTEYLTLTTPWGNTAPVDITGWSLQSALSGVRAYIPRGTPEFLMGTVSTQKNISLNPGSSATIATGHSPLGTSFRENICSGYLSQLQTFTPRLAERCPASREAVPLSAENLNKYGDACVDFARSLPACEAPLNNFAPELSFQCRNFLANTFSYNGCVLMYKHRANFAQDSWRVYLNSSRELWRNSHDVIRLLDSEGKTVDSITY